MGNASKKWNKKENAFKKKNGKECEECISKKNLIFNSIFLNFLLFIFHISILFEIY